MKGKFLVIFLVLGLVCCKKTEKKEEQTPADTYDKQALLMNMADNLILPCYADFKSSLDSLTHAYDAFKVSGSQSDYQVVKQKFITAYTKYQLISPFEFGPAENVIIRMNLNVFPTDSVQINSNIASGSYTLDAVNNLDAKGFPALDFLFYGNNKTELSCMNQFNASAAQRQYVSDLLNDMTSKINSVISSWNASYRNTFINSLGTDVGSSIGFLVNQMNYELDYLKNAKIGTPLGKKTLGIPEPTTCEAYYARTLSIAHAVKTLEAIENMYSGKGSSGTDGQGFDDYLDHLGIQYNGGTLNGAIKSQFALAKSKLLLIPDPLSVQVVSSPAVVDEAYMELVKLLVLLKTDLPSNLGVMITYQDGDGD